MTPSHSISHPDCSTNRAHPAFDGLCAHFRSALEQACGEAAEAFGARIGAALADAAPLIDCLPDTVLRGCATSYTRHVLASDPAGRFAAAALIWRPGQSTPVHGHHTWCGYRIMRGVLTEERFEWREAQAHAWRTGLQHRAAGAASFVGAGYEGIHRLVNYTDEVAISLHVYGVHADAMSTRVNQVVERGDAPPPLERAA